MCSLVSISIFKRGGEMRYIDFSIILLVLFNAQFLYGQLPSHNVPTAHSLSCDFLQYSKADRHPVTALEKIMESSFSAPQSFPEVTSPDRGSQPIKHHRYGQLIAMGVGEFTLEINTWPENSNWESTRGDCSDVYNYRSPWR